MAVRAQASFESAVMEWCLAKQRLLLLGVEWVDRCGVALHPEWGQGGIMLRMRLIMLLYVYCNCVLGLSLEKVSSKRRISMEHCGMNDSPRARGANGSRWWRRRSYKIHGYSSWMGVLDASLASVALCFIDRRSFGAATSNSRNASIGLEFAPALYPRLCCSSDCVSTPILSGYRQLRVRRLTPASGSMKASYPSVQEAAAYGAVRDPRFKNAKPAALNLQAGGDVKLMCWSRQKAVWTFGFFDLCG